MPKIAKELSAMAVNKLTTPGRYPVGGVAGLQLVVLPSGARCWVLRMRIGPKRRHMGLGPCRSVNLAQARDKARAAKAALDKGIDPIAERQKTKQSLLDSQALRKTFKQVATTYIDQRSKTWKGPKQANEWTMSFEKHVYPIVGSVNVAVVGQQHILQILEPIWHTKTNTASKLRGRLELVLSWAKARHYRSGDNPARWKEHLEVLLAPPNKVMKVKHHPALPVAQMPAFTKQLRLLNTPLTHMLDFTILCASRSGEVRHAVWSEFDLNALVWTIPATRMKTNVEHRVPLSTDAVNVLQGLTRTQGVDHVFMQPSGKLFGEHSMSVFLRTHMKVQAVPHGFRSTFRDWVGDCTHWHKDLAELALAHEIENKVEAAYRRGDALEKRREMMQAWADFIGGRSDQYAPQSEMSQGLGGESNP